MHTEVKSDIRGLVVYGGRYSWRAIGYFGGWERCGRRRCRRASAAATGGRKDYSVDRAD